MLGSSKGFCPKHVTPKDSDNGSVLFDDLVRNELQLASTTHCLNSQETSVSNLQGRAKVKKDTKSNAGRKKYKRRFVYLSPQIERRATIFETNTKHGQQADDILTDLELSATSVQDDDKSHKKYSNAADTKTNTKQTKTFCNSHLSDKDAIHNRDFIVNDGSQNRQCIQETTTPLPDSKVTKTLGHFLSYAKDPTYDAESLSAKGENDSTSIDLVDLPSMSLTFSDWAKVKEILNDLRRHYLGEDLDNSKTLDFSQFLRSNDFDVQTDLSRLLEEELPAFSELGISRKDTKAAGDFSIFGKQVYDQKSKSDRALDSVSSDILCGHFLLPEESIFAPCEDSSHGIHEISQNNLGSFAASLKANTCSVWPEDNINTSMSGEKDGTKLQKLKLKVQGLHKCSSAPELWHPVNKEVVRRVSHLDLSIAHKFYIKKQEDSTDDYNKEMPLLWGDEAYRQYKFLTLIEAREKIQMIKNAKADVIRKYLLRHRLLQHIVDVAKAYYSDPTHKNRKEWKQLRQEINQSKDHSITDIRHKLAQIPNFTPFFTYLLMLLQTLALVVMCSMDELAPAGVLSRKQVRRDIQTFLGAETIHRFIIPNPWIGPPVTRLLAAGASFAPCMRRDNYVLEHSQSKKYSKVNDISFGCCEMRGPLNASGTTTLEECNEYTNGAGAWGPPLCGKRLPKERKIRHVIKPCCTDHRGTCQMLSSEHCDFLGGTFHQDKEHCAEVFCIHEICRIGTKLFLIEPNPMKPWLANEKTAWQWWRFLLAQFYTYGILHCLPLLILEWLLMRPMEKNAGWFRVLVTYTLCGIAGQITAGLAQPYIIHVGTTGGVAGMIGEAAMELSYAWRLLENPCLQVLKLTFFLLLLLGMGLLPFVSLLATVMGFICGAICALIFMPYLTIDAWSWFRKVRLMFCGLLLLSIMYFALLIIYFQMQPEICQQCRSIECLSLTENMCNEWDLLG